MYHRFNTASSNPPENPPRLRTNTNFNCVVATTGDWRLAKCTDQHLVVCQSGKLIYNQFVSDRFSFLLRVLGEQTDRQQTNKVKTLEWHSRAHTSAKDSDPAKLLPLNKGRIKHTQCRPSPNSIP